MEHLDKTEFAIQYNSGKDRFWRGLDYFEICQSIKPYQVEIRTMHSIIRVSKNPHAIYRVFNMWQTGEIK